MNDIKDIDIDIDDTVILDLDEYDEIMEDSHNYNIIINCLCEFIQYNDITDKIEFKYGKEEEFLSIMKILSYKIRNIERMGRMSNNEDRNQDNN